MNYWLAESTNLSEMHQPMLDWIENLSKVGERTAYEYYRTRGWVTHQNSDIWCLANAVVSFRQYYLVLKHSCNT